MMLEELDEVVKMYGDGRRTVLLEEGGTSSAKNDEAAVEHQIADEDVVITLSHEGFVKRIPMHLYRRRVSSGKALAGMERYEDDYLERIFVARTSGWILSFTEQGQCFFLPVHGRARERQGLPGPVDLRAAGRGRPGGPHRVHDRRGRPGGRRTACSSSCPGAAW